MNNPQSELDPELQELLQSLKTVPERSQAAAQAGRAQFLSLLDSLGTPVSRDPKARHKGWINQFFRKGTPKMSALTTLFLIVSLVFGGTGATVVAAQSSLPEQPLYAVKMLSEQVRSELTIREQTRLELALEYANQRGAEIEKMVKAGQPVPETLQARLQQQLETALRLASGMTGEQQTQAMLLIQSQVRQMLQTMTQLQSPPDDAQLIRTRSMLQTCLQAAQQGIDDPQLLRQRVRNGQVWQTEEPGIAPQTATDTGMGNPWTDDTPTPGSAYGTGNGGNPWTDETPIPGSGYGSGNGGNPWTDDTPTPGSGYGTGNGGNPWTDDTPTPGSGYGTGNGGNPYASETPTPGSGYGPGPGPSATCTCTPGSGPGPGGTPGGMGGQPTQPGTGGGGGRP